MKHPWSHLHPFASRAAMSLPPELAHRLALKSLRLGHAALPKAQLEAKCQCMGLEFVNPVGLAAGLDKNAIALPAWEKCGFGFVEVGAVTPRPQPGNPEPRMFRLEEYGAIINRLGFNNEGMDAVHRRLERHRRRRGESSMRIGVNLGKNKDTPLERAADDYVVLMERFWRLADYLCVNISSPNTPGLRALGQPQLLAGLLERIAAAAGRLKQETGKDTPLALKIDPDQGQAQLTELLGVVRQYPVRALIATNTTCQRPSPVDTVATAQEAGGLSGRPLAPLALNIMRTLSPLARDSGIELIGCGGIADTDTAREFIAAGAKMVQVYTGFIYEGPQLIADLVEVF